MQKEWEVPGKDLRERKGSKRKEVILRDSLRWYKLLEFGIKWKQVLPIAEYVIHQRRFLKNTNAFKLPYVESILKNRKSALLVFLTYLPR